MWLEFPKRGWLLRDHDLRALLHVGVHLPRYRVKQILRHIKNRLRGKRPDYPLSLILLEIAGNLAGPWALWRSRRRVKREGYSQPYLPAVQRPTGTQGLPLAKAHRQLAVTHRREASRTL